MKYLFVLINLMFITLLIFLGVNHLYNQIGGGNGQMIYHENSSDKLVQKPIRQKPASVRSAYEDIIKRNLFGVILAKVTGPASLKTVAPPVEKLEDTKLRLKLMGTVTGKPNESFAVIEDQIAGKQALYHINQVVQDATIKAVLREQVILHYKGKDQILRMEREARGRKSRTAKVQESAGTDSETITMERSVVDDAMKNLNKLMSEVRIRPHFFEGKPDGLFLHGMKRNSLFAKMGFKNGDIIKGIDGGEIQSVDDALLLYKKLKNATDIHLQFTRKGKTKEINYHVE